MSLTGTGSYNMRMPNPVRRWWSICVGNWPSVAVALVERCAASLSMTKYRLVRTLLGPFVFQDEDDILENVAHKFHRIFTRNDHFKVGCALCILLSDNLLTRTQVSV